MKIQMIDKDDLAELMKEVIVLEQLSSYAPDKFASLIAF